MPGWPFEEWWRKPPPPLRPVDDRSRDDKLGIITRPEAVSDEPGRDWAWVLGQFEGRDYWDLLEPVLMRRKAWPVATLRRGLVLPDGDGGQRILGEAATLVWHIWRQSDVGDASRVDGRFVQGWGGQIGADHDEDDFVMVCGVRRHDGTSYTPSDQDRTATDWERWQPWQR